MARTYTLTDSTWRPRTLTKFMRQWASAYQPRILEPVTGEQTIGSVRAHLFAEGSLRGVEVELRARAFRTGAIEVTLGSLANLVDWGIAFALLRALMETGQGTLTDPDGSKVGIEKLTINEAEAEGALWLRSDAKTIKDELAGRGRPWAALSYPRFDLFVVPADLPKTMDEVEFARGLEQALLPRALKYHLARPLEIMQAGDGTAFAIWHLDDALVDALPHLAVTRDMSEGAFVVHWNEVVALMSGRMEVVSSGSRRFFLPALQPGNPKDDEIIERFIRSGTQVEAFLQAHVMQIG